MQMKIVTLDVNERKHQVALDPNVTLLDVLRDLGYTDVKNGCEIGECGACAVLLDGQPVNSCMVLAWQADRGKIITNSGLGRWNLPTPCRRALPTQGLYSAAFARQA